MAERIYFISGLGADKRIFRKLSLPTVYELIYIDWIVPVKGESLKDYALRLAAVIDISKPFYLVGVSFGGFIAIEIAKSFHPLHTFLISSLTTKQEMPWYYRLAGSLKLLHILPVYQFKSANRLSYKFFGAKTAEHKIMLKQIISDTDTSFLKWALISALNWKNTKVPVHVTHIHGTADQILPIRYTHPDLVINGGGHLMVYAHAEVVSQMITKVISAKSKE